jgi:hypothetical protein
MVLSSRDKGLRNMPIHAHPRPSTPIHAHPRPSMPIHAHAGSFQPAGSGPVSKPSHCGQDRDESCDRHAVTALFASPPQLIDYMGEFGHGQCSSGASLGSMAPRMEWCHSIPLSALRTGWAGRRMSVSARSGNAA